MSESRLPAWLGRDARLIIGGALVAVLAVVAIVYFTGARPGGPAEAESAAKVDVTPDNDTGMKRPKFPFMRLEAQYAGPFQDTVIQRWRDPIDGRVCYIYVPVRVKHAPVKDKNELIDYGDGNIGSISCSGPVMVRRDSPDEAPKPSGEADKPKP